jgi:hypothetical protein
MRVEMYAPLHVKCPILMTDFYRSWNVSIHLSKIAQYRISWISVQRFSSCYRQLSKLQHFPNLISLSDEPLQCMEQKLHIRIQMSPFVQPIPWDVARLINPDEEGFIPLTTRWTAEPLMMAASVSEHPLRFERNRVHRIWSKLIKAADIRVMFLWDVTPCSLTERYPCFSATHLPHYTSYPIKPTY